MLYPSYFISRIDSISTLAAMVQYACYAAENLAKAKFTTATRTCLGLISTRGGEGYRPMPWSIMSNESVLGQKAIMSPISTSLQIRNYLVGKLDEFGRQMHEKVTGPFFLMLEQCTHCAERGKGSGFLSWVCWIKVTSLTSWTDTASTVPMNNVIREIHERCPHKLESPVDFSHNLKVS